MIFGNLIIIEIILLLYDFSKQKKLLDIALEICDDYGAKEFSFGGGTLLSSGYYNHRMSYDIDIFTQDFSFIQNLIEKILNPLLKPKKR